MEDSTDGPIGPILGIRLLDANTLTLGNFKEAQLGPVSPEMNEGDFLLGFGNYAEKANRLFD